MFGIKQRGDVVGWDAAYKTLEEAVKGGAEAKEEPKKGETSVEAAAIATGGSPATPASPSTPVKEKVGAAAAAVAGAAAGVGSTPEITADKSVDVNSPVGDKSEKPSGGIEVPDSVKGGRRRTMTRAQVSAINKSNKEAMDNMPPELKKLIPELLATLSAVNVKKIAADNETNKVSAKQLARSVKDLNRETIKDMPLVWAQNTKEKSLPTTTMVAHSVEQWVGKGADEYARGGSTLTCAAYLVFGVESWTPELDKLYVREFKHAQEGSLADQLWGAFHNGQSLAVAAIEDEKNWPQAYKDAKAKADKEWKDRQAEIDKIDNARDEAWKSATSEYEAKWKEFCKANNYDPNDDDDFDIGSTEKIRELVKAFTDKYGQRPNYHKWLAAHPEFNSNAYREAHPVSDMPVLEEYEEAEAKRKAEEAAGAKSILNTGSIKPGDLKQLTPPLDPTMLGPMNKTNVVQPAEISLPKLEMAKQQSTSTETANVFEQYRKEQQEAAARQQQSLDQMNEMFTAMNPFFKQFGSVIDEKNGLRVAGIPELTAITAAKPAGGNTQIINNTIVQDQNDGLDLRKKQN